MQDTHGALFSTLMFIPNPFLQSMTQIGAGTALKQLPVRITTVINNRVHEQRTRMQPREIYHRTVRGTHSAPLHLGLRAGTHRHLTVDLRSPPRPPMSLADGRHPPAPLPRYSRHHAEACCTARVARAAWGADEASALISANRSAPGVPERACGADAALGQSPEHGPGVRCKAIHITGFGARRFHSSARYHWMHQ